MESEAGVVAVDNSSNLLGQVLVVLGDQPEHIFGSLATVGFLAYLATLIEIVLSLWVRCC